MRKAKVLLGLEDLEISPEFTPEQVTAAEATLNSNGGIQSIYAQFDEVGTMAASGQVVLEVTDRLEQFAEQADEQIRVGNYTPQVVEVFTTATQNELSRIDETDSLPSVESFGSNRVALEANVQTVKDRIKSLYEWFLKAVARIRAALAALWHRLWDEFERAKATAITRAAQAKSLIGKDDTSKHIGGGVKSKYGEVSFNSTHLGSGSDHSVSSIMTGLNETLKAIPDVAKGTLDVAKNYSAAITAIVKRAETELLPVDSITRLKVTLYGHEYKLSGGTTMQYKDLSGRVTLYVTPGPAGSVVEVATPKPTEIDAVARTVVSVIGQLEGWRTTLPKLAELAMEQEKAVHVLEASITTTSDDTKANYAAQFSRILVQAKRDFQTELTVHGARAVLEIVHAANEFTRRSLANYKFKRVI